MPPQPQKKKACPKKGKKDTVAAGKDCMPATMVMALLARCPGSTPKIYVLCRRR